MPIGDDQVYSLILLNNYLGGSMSSRLFQEIREKRGLCYSVFSYHSSYFDNGLLTIYAGTGHQQLPDLANAIQDTILRVADRGLSEQELLNGKEQLKGNMMLSLESTNSRMSRNGKNELLLGTHRSLDEIIEEIDRVDVSSVNQLASSILKSKPSISLIQQGDTVPAIFQ